MSDLIDFDPIDKITEIDDLRELLHDQQAEIARLREALGRVSNVWVHGHGPSAAADTLTRVKQFARAALSTDPAEQALAADVVRLVIAARAMALGDWYEDREDFEAIRKELDDASEAFASRVEWPDTPDDDEQEQKP